MYKLAFIFLFLAFSKAKVVKKYAADTDLDSAAKAIENELKVCLAEEKDTLWVLEIVDDDLNFKQLRSANKMDNRVFREIMAPAIKLSKYQDLLNARNGDIHPKIKSTKNATDLTKTSKKESNADDITKYDVKKVLHKMIKKFILSYEGEPNLNLHEGDNNRMSVKLYFKGPYTTLVIRYKNKRWHYFMNPPSSLPRWFYEKHAKAAPNGRAMYIEVPETIRNEFYVKFFYLLNSLLSFAI